MCGVTPDVVDGAAVSDAYLLKYSCMELFQFALLHSGELGASKLNSKSGLTAAAPGFISYYWVMVYSPNSSMP